MRSKIEIFVLGIGSRTNKIPLETIQYIRSLKIGFEILPTVKLRLFQLCI